MVNISEFINQTHIATALLLIAFCLMLLVYKKQNSHK